MHAPQSHVNLTLIGSKVASYPIRPVQAHALPSGVDLIGMFKVEQVRTAHDPHLTVMKHCILSRRAQIRSRSVPETSSKKGGRSEVTEGHDKEREV